MKRILIVTLHALLLSLYCTAFAAPAGLYWTDSGIGTIQYAVLDGQNITTLVDGLSNPQGIYVTDNFLYWTDRNDQLIRKANADGANIEVLLNTAPGVPRDLAVTSDSIYWVNTFTDNVSRANIDGSGATALVTDNLSFPNGIAVTSTNLYWSDSGNTSITRSNLDGTGVVELVSGLGTTHLPSDVYVTNDFIYWTTRDLALTAGGTAVPGTIQRANLDGTNITTLIDDLVFPQHVVATPDYLYWADQNTGKIQRSNLDGTNKTDIVVGLTTPVGLAAVTETLPIINSPDYEAKLYATGLGAITGLARDSSGTLYATDYLNGRVLKLSDDGTFVVYATGLPYATDVAFTQDGRLFVTSSTGGSSNVYQVNTDGSLSVYASGFSFPTSIESWGNDLYVSNSGDGTISRIDTAGNISTFLSGFSAPHGPFGISFDESGNMYFTDHGTGNVYTSDLAGNVQYLGTITPLGAIYTVPDNLGNVFVSSSALASIYEIDYLGNRTLFATNFTGKSSPPVIGPTDMLFDDNGNMFVGDGNSIWKLSRKIVTVTIDIKPGTYPNSINLKSNGLISVAILTTEDFDAGQVDPDSVTFCPDGAHKAHEVPHMEDVDGDGDYDQVYHFHTQETGIACGDTEATLTGQTWEGTPVSGTDNIRTVGCRR